MQHGRCAGCNVDITLDMTYASQKLENMDRTVVRPGNIPRVHEELPTHTHRHSQGTKAGSLDMDGSEDFHRRLSLDEVDPSQFPETYCDRMSGIELDKMKDARDSMFPLDKRWPFLLRMPATIFGITMGISSQSIVWKGLATQTSMEFLHLPAIVGTVLWIIGIVMLVVTSVAYSLKVYFWPKAVYREFVHPIRSNFLVQPFLSALFLLLGAPKLVNNGDQTSIIICAFIFSVPVLFIEVHFYGHWLMGGHNRRLSAVVNPTTQISVIGNFIAATAFAVGGWNDLALFLFSAGLLHQLVVFLTIYMRLPSNAPLVSQLHPVLFLFVAPPCTAATSWFAISGEVDYFAKILTFIGLFLYLLLASRANHLVRGVRFSLAWWAYTFPMGAAALAAMTYASANHCLFAKVLAAGLSFISSATVMFVSVYTVARTFTGHLFPNDEVVGVCLTPDPSVRNEISNFSNPISAAS
ncbi:hypothetical protein M758_2G160100 [Ceratodon purpureus]|nr:hypothetical protein M758_2G160100 [Ceratodon purpureus]